MFPPTSNEKTGQTVELFDEGRLTRRSEDCPIEAAGASFRQVFHGGPSMKFFVFTLLFAASTAQADIAPNASLEEAFKLVPLCQGAVTADATRIARVASVGQVAVTGVGDQIPLDILMPETPRDLRLKGNTLYALFKSKIQEWDLTTRKMTHEVATTFDEAKGPDEAQGMEWADEGTLIIAHGRRGYAIYDTVAHETSQMHRALEDQAPLESSLTDVAVVDDRAIFTVTNVTLQSAGRASAFRGFLVVDLRTYGEIHRTLGLDSGAENLFVIGDDVVVGYGLLTQSFRLSEISGRSRVRLRKATWKFPLPGHPLGQPAVVGDQLFTCFLQNKGPERHRIPAIIPTALLRP